jgi:hypothetical protein
MALSLCSLTQLEDYLEKKLPPEERQLNNY